MQKKWNEKKKTKLTYNRSIELFTYNANCCLVVGLELAFERQKPPEDIPLVHIWVYHVWMIVQFQAAVIQVLLIWIVDWVVCRKCIQNQRLIVVCRTYCDRIWGCRLLWLIYHVQLIYAIMRMSWFQFWKTFRTGLIEGEEKNGNLVSSILHTERIQFLDSFCGPIFRDTYI